MALRAAPRTFVVGSTTAGADGNVSQILLPGGLRTMISGIGVFYPVVPAASRYVAKCVRKIGNTLPIQQALR